MKFRISKLVYRHSGQTDAYWQDTGETVEAEDAAHAPGAYAAKKGFERATRWTEAVFQIGDQRYILSPY